MRVGLTLRIAMGQVSEGDEAGEVELSQRNQPDTINSSSLACTSLSLLSSRASILQVEASQGVPSRL